MHIKKYTKLKIFYSIYNINTNRNVYTYRWQFCLTAEIFSLSTDFGNKEAWAPMVEKQSDQKNEVISELLICSSHGSKTTKEDWGLDTLRFR